MRRMMLFGIVISFCISASDPKGNLYERDIFGQLDPYQMRKLNSLMDKFMCGNLLPGYSGKARVMFAYSDYEKPSVTYYSYSDDIHSFVFGLHERVRVVEQETGCLRAHLTVINGRLRLNEKELAVVQAIRLYDFLNGKLAYPEEIEEQAERIQRSPCFDQVKQSLMRCIEASLPYKKLNDISANRAEYIRIFLDQSVGEMKKDHGRLNWDIMTLPQFVQKMEQCVAQDRMID